MLNKMSSTWLLLILICSGTSQGETRPGPVDQAEFGTWFEQVSNRGRWGPADQLGTLNLITPAVRRSAAQEVTTGISVSLARTAETSKAADNASPFAHVMIGVGTPPADDGLMRGLGADRFDVAFHGFAHTHIDALCHIFHKGELYTGYAQEKVTPQGAEVLSVLSIKDGILTRGVLIDLPAHLGLDYLPDDHVITVEELDRWEADSGIRIRRGDAVLIRTGRWAKRKAEGPWEPMTGAAGVHPRVATWLKARDVALVGSDLTMDALPSLVDGSPFPFHELAVAGMGMPILDALELEAVREVAIDIDRAHFMLTIAPLAVDGATGSPVNPIATF